MSENLFTLKNVSFMDRIHYKIETIPKYKVSFITGESGAGKTTLLKLLNKTQSYSGTIFLEDVDIVTISPITLRREVLLVSQEPVIFGSTILDSFHFLYETRKEPMPSQQDISEYLELCALPMPLNKNCTEMSGGELSRLYTALFLSFSKRVLMLDEPTAALDSETSFRLMENVISYCKRKKIELLVISHNKNIVDRFSENTICIN